ncbi:hypothetical protein [Mammaliicoccus sciuri]|nr:hypothetical protein [Mammaliicoccus sciuri]MEB7816263.1 hypothetical protein [Mammaliicoccus sciuri]
MQINNKLTKDPQVAFIHNEGKFLGDKFIRIAKPHKLLSNNKIIAVKLP